MPDYVVQGQAFFKESVGARRGIREVSPLQLHGRRKKSRREHCDSDYNNRYEAEEAVIRRDTPLHVPQIPLVFMEPCCQQGWGADPAQTSPRKIELRFLWQLALRLA